MFAEMVAEDLKADQRHAPLKRHGHDVVVIPLLADCPAVKDLNPELVHDGQHRVLATRLIAAVRRTSLRRVGSAADQADPISRAIDVLMAGV